MLSPWKHTVNLAHDPLCHNGDLFAVSPNDGAVVANSLEQGTKIIQAWGSVDGPLFGEQSFNVVHIVA